jgi:hypothetical protein
MANDYETLKKKCDLVIHGLESLDDQELTQKFFKVLDDYTLELRKQILDKMMGKTDTN